MLPLTQSHCRRDRQIHLSFEDGDVVDVTPEKVVICIKKEKNTKPSNVRFPSFTSFLLKFLSAITTTTCKKKFLNSREPIADTLEGVQGITGAIFGFEAPEMFKRLKRVLIIACGTSYYAGMIGKYWIESIAKVPVDVEIASEYRYRESVPDLDTLVLTISQSGETADTLAALRHAQDLGMDMTMTFAM